MRKKQWYVAHVLCITLIFFPPKKLRGPEGGPERGGGGGPGFVYTRKGKVKVNSLFRHGISFRTIQYLI